MRVVKSKLYLSLGFWVLGLLSVYGALVAVALWQHRNTMEQEHENALRILEQEFITILAGYETAAMLMYDEYNSRADALEPISRAATARRELGIPAGSPPSEIENEARVELHEALLPLYERLQRFGFRQLHVHMPDNSSFLRMHSPEVYGDDLSSVRRTVETANRELRFVRGFEEGRVFNGYRFIVPLFELNTPTEQRSSATHIGSVEIGVGFAALITDLSELFDKSYNFVLSRHVMEDAVFPEFQSRYDEWWFFDEFLEDPETEGRSLLAEMLPAGRNRPLQRSIRKRLGAFDRFAVHVPHRSLDYLIAFLPVTNPDGRPVGYFKSIELRPALGTYRRSLIAIIATLTVASLSIGVLGFQSIKRGRTLEYMAGHDQLTGLLNRHMFEELFHRARADQNRHGRPMALIILDIDHFKRLNDLRGHNFGDEVLVRLAEVLKSSIRAGDIAARWGGEEFIVLLKGIELKDAARVAENLRRAVRKSCGKAKTEVTASFGVVAVPNSEGTLESYVGKADTRLYRAKELGRNKVVYNDVIGR